MSRPAPQDNDEVDLSWLTRFIGYATLLTPYDRSAEVSYWPALAGGSVGVAEETPWVASVLARLTHSGDIFGCAVGIRPQTTKPSTVPNERISAIEFWTAV